MLVRLYNKGKLHQRIVAVLMSPDADLRLLICARSVEKAEASFPSDLVHDAKKITIPPLRERKSEIPELMDQWFIAACSSLRFSALRDELRENLLSYSGPENLHELRDITVTFGQLAHCRTARQATEEFAVSRGTLRGWAKKLNTTIRFPITT